VAEELLEGGYSDKTPVAVVCRASWEDEIVVRSSLKDLAEKVEALGVKKQALILVGDALKPKLSEGKIYRSKLYGSSSSRQ
jgi:precorrin-4/cobalt-precorrin-4 C11-methyltransferase